MKLQDLSFVQEERMGRDFVVAGVSDPVNTFVSCLYDEDIPIGMNYVAWDSKSKSSVLWYIAAHPDVRSKGIGSYLYALSKGWSIGKGSRYMWLEADVPGTDEWSERRIAWYRRMGCVRLEGIEYFQTVDTTDVKTSMAIMVDFLVDPSPTPQEVFDVVLQSAGPENLRQTGKLRFA